jgi:HAD superfamily hydrolase (TIGR02253 family)
MTKAVLFDLDNTLIDFTRFKKKAVQAAARAMVKAGLQANPAKLAEELLEYYYGYGIESDDAFESFLKKKFGRVDFRVLAAAVNAYLHEKYVHLKPFPGVVDTLTILRKRGLMLGVVSDGVRLKAWMRLNAAGLDDFFDVVVAFEDTGRRKPAKEPFLKACKLLKVKPQECLFVGDWPERDIAGAKQLGMRTCLAAYGQSSKSVTPADCVIKSIDELLRFI